MRLFFAIELPEDVRTRLARLAPPPSDPDYRAVAPSGMHVTLAFLGEEPAERLERLKALGAGAASASRGGTLSLGEAGSFGPRRAPRVLWVGLKGDVDRLAALQSRLSAALAASDFRVEDPPFSPHITLARRRQTARGGAPVGWPPPIESARFPVQVLTLFESRLSPRGATYVPVETFGLGS